MTFICKDVSGLNNFDYDTFKLKYEDKKRRTFFEYIEENFGETDKKYILKNMSEEQIISSLEYYISTGVKYQITANNYFSYLTRLFDDLSKDYGIINNLFSNKTQYENLLKQVKQKTSQLKDSELKEIALDDDFLEVQESLRANMRALVEKLYNDEKVEIFIRKPNKASSLKSMLATSLVFDLGLKGNVITAIKLQDYNCDENTLTINRIKIKLRSEYQLAIKIYLKYREYVLKSKNVKTDYFFINTLGKSYFSEEKNPDYTGLFSYLNNKYGHVATNQYAFNKIIKFIHKGVDVSTLNKITGHSLEKIIQLLEYYNEEIKNLSPEDYFKNSEDEREKISIDSIDEEFMVCPNCKRKVISNASEWVVIIYEDENIPRLVCKHCGGKDEKDYI